VTDDKAVVAVIPARYGSTRFPAKPLAEIAGKPMIRHVYERASQAHLVTRVVVATDDERIASVVMGFGGQAVMTPVAMRTGTDRVAYVARSLAGARIIVNVQGDEPLIEPAMIDEAVGILQDDESVSVGTLVKTISDAADLTNPNVVKVVLDAKGSCLYFSRSPIPFGRDVDEGAWLGHHIYYKHIGLYVFRRSFLLGYPDMQQTPLERAEKLEQLRILEHGERIRAAVTTHESIPVDTIEDLERVRSLIGQTT
jgi:3-deoxy-manno-octulosonate cytidylyltransferase (CMP-KDO synthetase)